MLTIDLDQFMVELKEGTVKHAGASNTSATAKLYDVTDVDARPFGGERVKIVFADDEDNECEVALFPEQARALYTALDGLEVGGDVLE